jgi:tetratricopeptide (TPR) repeat protein
VKAFARRGFARFSQGKYKAAALDYLEAMRLDSANEEYPKFLAKSRDLYASTEGKPLVFEEVQSATSDKRAIEQAPIRIVQSVIQSALFGEWEEVNCERVQSLSGLLVPAREISLSKKAMMRTFASSSNNDILPTENINVDDEDKDEAYVKIPVSFVDDDDDESANENTDRPQFVRIAIAENDDEDEETNSAQNDTLNLEANAGVTKQMTSEEKALQLKNYGNSMMLRYDWNSSIAAYSRSLFHQFSIATLNNRAQAKLSSQDFAGAIADTNEVLNGEPNNVKALYRRAKAHFELQHWDACQRDLNIILQLEPHNAPALKMQHNITDILCQQQAELCKTQGNVLFQQGDISQALQLYTTSLELVPNNPSVLSNRALAFLALEQFSESISDCDSVIADSKGNTTDATAAIVRKAYQRRSEARFRRVSSSTAETQLLEKQSELKCALEDAESALELAMLHSPENVDKQKYLIKDIRKYIDSLTEYSSLPPPAIIASVTPSKVTRSQEESPAAIQRESSESATKSVKKISGSAQKGRLSESRVGVPATPAKTLYEYVSPLLNCDFNIYLDFDL